MSDLKKVAIVTGGSQGFDEGAGSLGVNVNAVAPGFVDTDMTGQMGEEHKAKIARRSALKRTPEAVDAADAVPS
jgi:3-oxoacyl-[acyl-carrier protein] reductase